LSFRMPFVRPAGGVVESSGTPFVPTLSEGHGAQVESKAPRRFHGAVDSGRF
jgi:hypothetical protein